MIRTKEKSNKHKKFQSFEMVDNEKDSPAILSTPFGHGREESSDTSFPGADRSVSDLTELLGGLKIEPPQSVESEQILWQDRPTCIVVNIKQNTTTWHRFRKGRVTASMISALCGRSIFST